MDLASEYRYIDRKGIQVIPGSFTGASSFVMGRAHVSSGVDYNKASWAYIDPAGHPVFRYSESSVYTAKTSSCRPVNGL